MDEKPIVIEDNQVQLWNRQLHEATGAYNAFCLYRDFGPLRNIKKVLKLHSLEVGKAGTWYRWSRKYEWNKRVTAYDDWCDKERQKRFTVEEQQRADTYKNMLGKFEGLVDKRLDTIKPNELSAMQTMDLLERSYGLGERVTRSIIGEDDKPKGQLQINFVDAFDGV